MKPFIVVCDGMDKQVFEKLQQMEELEIHPQSKIGPRELNQLLPQTAGLVVRSNTRVDKELLAKALQLRYVIRAGEGTDNIDKVQCAQRGIKVSNTPGANNNSAAEHALALMLTVLRKTAWAHSSMARGAWEKSLWTGNELWRKKIGIVGFGRVGQIVAKRLMGFEPKILYYDPFVSESPLKYAHKAQNLEDLFRDCDIVTLHTPLMESTRGLVSHKLLGAMPTHAVLINVSRGGIVDEDALFDALSQNKIRGAGFDVFATEPLEENHRLRNLPNLIMTPHLGASTEEAQKRVGEMAVHQLESFFCEQKLLNEVT